MLSNADCRRAICRISLFVIFLTAVLSLTCRRGVSVSGRNTFPFFGLPTGDSLQIVFSVLLGRQPRQTLERLAEDERIRIAALFRDPGDGLPGMFEHLQSELHPETADQFDFSTYDYVVDAVDTVTAKVTLVLEAQKAGVPIISCMGAGNKLDPTRFRVADIYKTSGCPLARVMRTALRKRGVKHLKVVYSDEIPTRPIEDMSISCRSHCICPPGAKHKCTERRDIPGSTAFVPSVAGLIIAGEVVKDLAKR